MIVPVWYPIAVAIDQSLQLAVSIGNKDTQARLEAEQPQWLEQVDEALAQVDDLLNDGYTLFMRERVQTDKGHYLLMLFHKPIVTVAPEQTAICEAIRLYNNPPEGRGGAGECEHPDTIRLRAVMDVLLKTGIFPDAEPPLSDEDTHKIPVVLEEVDW